MGVFQGSSHLGRPLFLCGPEFVHDDQALNSYGYRSPYMPIGPRLPEEIYGEGANYANIPVWKHGWWAKEYYFSNLVAFSYKVRVCERRRTATSEARSKSQTRC